MNHEEKINRAIEQQMTPEEWESFQREVIDNEDLREQYIEAAWLHGQLLAERDQLPGLLQSEYPRVGAARSILPWSLAAALAIGLLALTIFSPRQPETVAILAEANNCRWAGSELPTNEGARLSSGMLHLTEGMATIAFESGARVTLEAPARLHVLSKMRCRLIDGSVVAEVPESAHGFVIDTEQMHVIDLGTKFGLTTNEFGNSHVYVFEGEVEVHPESEDEGEKETRLLQTGNALHIGSKKPADNLEISRQELDTDLSESGWTPIPTFSGRGKDTFLRKGQPDYVFGDEPLFMVKHTTLAESNERRGLISIDLGKLSPDEITDAKLTLSVQSSGLGFSSMVPDSRFAVYGVSDESLDRWKEDRLCWENAPQFTTELLDPNTFSKVGTFEVRRGASQAPIEITSPEMSDFLRSDTNGFATFLIVRETDEFDKQGLVHAFAAKEHPGSRAPTLWIKSKTAP